LSEVQKNIGSLCDDCIHNQGAQDNHEYSAEGEAKMAFVSNNVLARMLAQKAASRTAAFRLGTFSFLLAINCFLRSHASET
jgi:hypothetical protein